MKKILFGVAALGLLGLAGAGIGLKAQDTVEAKAAAEITSVTLKGTFDSWGAGRAFTKQSNGDYTLSWAVPENAQFKILVQGGADEWVGIDWGTSVDYDSEFVGAGESNNNYKALSSKTLNFVVKSTFYTNYGSDVSIQLGESRTVQFVDTTGSVFADTDNLDLNKAEAQYSGLITTTTANAKFRVKDVIGEATSYYAALEDDVTVATAASVEDVDYINVTAPGTYSVYFKKDTHKCWIEAASAGAEAYMYSNYFLNNVGCDENGVSAPSGWSSCAARYGLLSDGAKDYIYDAESNWEINDDLYRMIQTYEWALSHNPNKESMAHFIVNSSGDPRTVSGAATVLPSAFGIVSGSSAALGITIATVASFVGVGLFFFAKKKRED